MRPIPHKVLVPFLQRVEANILRVYDDKNPKKVLRAGDKVAGVLTAGVGHIGSELKIGLDVTADMSTNWLKSDLVYKAAAPLERKIGKVVDALTEHQYAALLSFVFNLGTGDPKKPEWTIWKRLRAGQLDQVPGEMLKFVNWNGQKSAGLINRRTAEIQLWHSADPQTADTAPPSSVTRVESTPPTPASPRTFSAPVITAAGTAVAAGSTAVAKISETLQPFGGHSAMLDNLISTLVLVAAGLAVAGVIVAWLKHRADRN